MKKKEKKRKAESATEFSGDSATAGSPNNIVKNDSSSSLFACSNALVHDFLFLAGTDFLYLTGRHLVRAGAEHVL